MKLRRSLKTYVFTLCTLFITEIKMSAMAVPVVSVYNPSANFVGLHKVAQATPSTSSLELEDSFTKGQFERGLITKQIMWSALKEGSASINMMKRYTPNFTTNTHENIPNYIQDILNFDATLPRLQTIIIDAKGQIFIPTVPAAKGGTPPIQGIPGVRIINLAAINTYQFIVDGINAAPAGNQNAIAAIKGLESVLWKIYDKTAYYGKLFSSSSLEKTEIPYVGYHGQVLPYFSLPSSGIRGPKYYLPWTKEKPELEQIIQEVENLAKIARKHSSTLAGRMQATASAYRHWMLSGAIGTIGGIGLAAGTGAAGAAALGAEAGAAAIGGAVGLAGTHSVYRSGKRIFEE